MKYRTNFHFSRTYRLCTYWLIIIISLKSFSIFRRYFMDIKTDRVRFAFPMLMRVYVWCLVDLEFVNLSRNRQNSISFCSLLFSIWKCCICSNIEPRSLLFATNIAFHSTIYLAVLHFHPVRGRRRGKSYNWISLSVKVMLLLLCYAVETHELSFKIFLMLAMLLSRVSCVLLLIIFFSFLRQSMNILHFNRN